MSSAAAEAGRLRAALSRPLLARLALALAIGAVGGAIAHQMRMPLAWMLGPMLATFAASMARAPVAVPMRLRAGFLAVLGVFLGSSFTPHILEQAAQWPASLAAVLAYVPLVTVLCAAYYRRVAGLDRVTALFASTPGALTPMIVLGAAAGGNEQHIALTQSLRVMLLVLAAPVIVFLIRGPGLGSGAASGAAQAIPLAPADAALLAACALAAILGARRLGLPAAEMTGAMFVSAGLYISGAVAGKPPMWLLDVTLVVLGAAIGSRFAGIDRRVLARLAGHAVAATALVLALTGVAAAAVSSLLGLDFLSVLLALAPGGVAEMSLIAVSLNIEPSFVALHHLVRIFEILLLAPLVAKAVAARG